MFAIIELINGWQTSGKYISDLSYASILPQKFLEESSLSKLINRFEIIRQ